MFVTSLILVYYLDHQREKNSDYLGQFLLLPLLSLVMWMGKNSDYISQFSFPRCTQWLFKSSEGEEDGCYFSYPLWRGKNMILLLLTLSLVKGEWITCYCCYCLKVERLCLFFWTMGRLCLYWISSVQSFVPHTDSCVILRRPE